MVRFRNFFPNRVLIQMIVVIFVMAMCALVFVFGVRSTVRVPVVFDVVNGDSVSGVANRLYKQELIDSVDVFKISVRLHGGKIQKGQYDIPKGTSTWKIARMFATGDVAATVIVIPEGLTVKQIKKLLLNSHDLVGDVECKVENTEPVCNIKDGQLFPDTYRVARGTKRLAVLDLARKKMLDVRNHFAKAYRTFPKPLKNWDEVITLASIVQKETPQIREMSIVASVYLNRLNKKMRLQADPTVVYALTNGLGDMQEEALLRGHLKIDSPYNTYRNSGLPPAPIANVGQNAIRAVLNPAKTNFLYFVADGQGGHHFSDSYEVHMKNHANWRQIKNMKKND